MEKKKKDQYKTYKSKSNNEYLYLLRTGKYGKVGITGNLYKRLMQYRSHNPLCDLIAYGNMDMLEHNQHPYLVEMRKLGMLDGSARAENVKFEKQLLKIAKYRQYDLDWVEYDHIYYYAIDIIRAAGGFVDKVGVPLKMFFKNPTLFLPETKIQIIE